MMKKADLKLLLCMLSVSVVLSACGDSKKSSPAPVLEYHNVSECQNQVLNTGIKGNTACPYKGQFDPNYGYDGYAIHLDASAHAQVDLKLGVGFRLDFGRVYNDICPETGQVPVFQYGDFSHCELVNPTYSRIDYHGYTEPGTGECAGDQHNVHITGCKPNHSPSNVYR